jgi:hypothetical protein
MPKYPTALGRFKDQIRLSVPVDGFEKRVCLFCGARNTPPVEPFVLACQDSGAVPTLRMAADHGEFAFRSPHQPMQICGLGRYACGKATGCKPPTVVEALGISFDYKREEAFAQSG